MSASRIESTSYQNHGRIKFMRYGHHQTPEGRYVLGVAHCLARPGNVPAVALAWAGAYFAYIARTWEKVALIMTVQGDVHNTLIFVKYLLYSIAMMNVPVHNEHSGQFMLRRQHLGGQSHRIEETKAQCLLELCMMAYIQNSIYKEVLVSHV